PQILVRSVNAQELFQMMLELRDEGGYVDVAVCITTGRQTHLLWLSEGEIKRELKRLLRRGVAEAFITIRLNGSTKFVADAQPLRGIDKLRATHILWAYGSAHHRWEMKLH